MIKFQREKIIKAIFYMDLKPHLYEGDKEIPEDLTIVEIMHEVPSFDTPNIEHYLKARERNSDALEKLTFKYRLHKIEQDQKEAMLYGALLSSDVNIQKAVMDSMKGQLIEDRLQSLIDEKILKALDSNNPEENVVGAEMIKSGSKELQERANDLLYSKLYNFLSSEDQKLKKLGAKMIQHIPSDEMQNELQNQLFKVLEEDLLVNNKDNSFESVDLMRYLPNNLLSNLVEILLNEGSGEVKICVADYIRRLPPILATPLLQKIFESNDLNLKKKGAQVANKVFDKTKKQPDIPQHLFESITSTVEEGLQSEDEEAQLIASEMLKEIPPTDKQIELIKRASQKENPQVLINGLKAIRYIATDKEENKETMLKIVDSSLKNEDASIQKMAVKVSRFIPEPQKSQAMNTAFELVSELLKSDDLQNRQLAAEMLYYVNHPKSSELFKIIEEDKKLLENLMFSRLYPDLEESDQFEKSFPKRVSFEKTGSEMTVLRGGSLEKKVLVRHIKEKAFIGWMEAFESSDVWLENGFDYVPVEPIQSFAIHNKKVDVYAGVLDIDLKHWLHISGNRFKEELKADRQKIIETLSSIGVRHGDLHEGNFFLKFPRDKDGYISTNEYPRIYVGDFDKSNMKIKD